MLKRLASALLAFALASAATAAPVIIHAGGTGSHTALDEPSTGKAMPVSAGTSLEYLRPNQVWWNEAGSLMVCRYPAQRDAWTDRSCRLAGNTEPRSGWTLLDQVQRAGYELAGVQVNETREGPSIVLYWRPVKR